MAPTLKDLQTIGVTPTPFAGQGVALDLKGKVPALAIPSLAQISTVTNSDATASAAYVDLANVGPTITVAITGNYIFQWGFQATSAAPASGNAQAGLFKNGSDQSLAAVADVFAVANGVVSASRGHLLALLAGDVVKMEYLISNASSTNFLNRWMIATYVT